MLYVDFYSFLMFIIGEIIIKDVNRYIDWMVIE